MVLKYKTKPPSGPSVSPHASAPHCMIDPPHKQISPCPSKTKTPDRSWLDILVANRSNSSAVGVEGEEVYGGDNKVGMTSGEGGLSDVSGTQPKDENRDPS